MKQLYCTRCKDQNIDTKQSKISCLTITKHYDEVNKANKLREIDRPKY